MLTDDDRDLGDYKKKTTKTSLFAKQVRFVGGLLLLSQSLSVSIIIASVVDDVNLVLNDC